MLMHEIVTHKTGLPSDANDKLAIYGVEPSAGGAHSTYRIAHPDCPVASELVFQTLDRVGLTNEALVAIVIDRLTAFQAGSFSCLENSEALENFVRGLRALQRRTSRRITQGIEGKLVESEEAHKARVRTEDGKLIIGNITCVIADMAAWSTWSLIEAAAKRLIPKITNYEMSVLENVASLCGSGGKNGFAELKSALANLG